MVSIPEVFLSSGGSRPIPLAGMGTAGRPVVPENIKLAVPQAIELGYRHFDTASLYETERSLGDAIAGALQRGLVKSRSELFVTSKLWCSDAHRVLVLPALQRSLRYSSERTPSSTLLSPPNSRGKTHTLFPRSEKGANFSNFELPIYQYISIIIFFLRNISRIIRSNIAAD